MLKKKSFFERLTGSIRLADEDEDQFEPENKRPSSFSTLGSRNPVSVGINSSGNGKNNVPMHIDEHQEAPVEEEGQLTVDVYQTPSEIVIQTMVAGVEPQNLSVTITRDMVTIRGKREAVRGVDEDSYFLKELYWGSFSRTIDLPQEIEPDEADAIEKHGLLIIKLPKINKDKQTVLKIKSF